MFTRWTGFDLKLRKVTHTNNSILYISFQQIFEHKDDFQKIDNLNGDFAQGVAVWRLALALPSRTSRVQAFPSVFTL